MAKDKKLISVVTPCFNEEANVREIYARVKSVFASVTGYRYEQIFIDNASTDNTVSLLKEIADADKNVKIIVNARNFGHIRSPYYGLLQARGDAVISIASDLQDSPAMITDFLKKWEEGFKIVIAVKHKSRENPLLFALRRFYYKLVKMISETEQVGNFTGFGLYDRKVIEILRQFDDPYPYFRGIIAEIGFPRAEIEFVQPRRLKGRSSNNFYSLYDLAMLGFVNYSKVPLRLAAFIGGVFSIICFLLGVVYLVYKLVYWQRFQLGIAPVVIGVFFSFSVMLAFIGIIGEYIGAIYTQVKNRPLVIEKERINFED
ncbi:MAG: glycosyltransferase family 2 protein [Candidatus Aureabacteria bacterium]|nr:glycosyltransferase family 2 protein [Candidatus Auribacterota bacterium]